MKKQGEVYSQYDAMEVPICEQTESSALVKHIHATPHHWFSWERRDDFINLFLPI